MAGKSVVSSGTLSVADQAISSAFSGLQQNGGDSDVSVFHLTQAEMDDLELLGYLMGVSRNACVNYATKYLTLLACSALRIVYARALRASKTNPVVPVEFKLNPEVKSAVKSARARKLFDGMSDADVAKASVLYLCKKLLPARNRRKALNGLIAERAS